MWYVLQIMLKEFEMSSSTNEQFLVQGINNEIGGNHIQGGVGQVEIGSKIGGDSIQGGVGQVVSSRPNIYYLERWLYSTVNISNSKLSFKLLQDIFMVYRPLIMTLAVIQSKEVLDKW